MLPALLCTPLLSICSIQSRGTRTTPHTPLVRVSRIDRMSVSPQIIMQPFDLQSEKSSRPPATLCFDCVRGVRRPTISGVPFQVTVATHC